MTDTTILIVEDEVFISDLYKRILTQSGFKILTAYDGNEAIVFAIRQPSLILLDIMLPKKNGIEILRELKTNPQTSKIPVILLTNLGQEDIIKTAIDIGAQGCILKSTVTPYELVEKVKQFIDNPT